MKKVISAALAALTLLGAMPVLPASAAASVYEFENGTIYTTGENETQTISLTGAGGGKAVDLKEAGDSVTVKVNVPSAGSYRLSLRYSQPYDEGGKYQDLIVNDTNVGQLLCGYTADNAFSEVSAAAYLKAGDNTVTIQAAWAGRIWTVSPLRKLPLRLSGGHSPIRMRVQKHSLSTAFFVIPMGTM